MGKGGDKGSIEAEEKTLTWTEVTKHRQKDDKWLVIEGQVYNITEWSKKHPGGSRLISHYAGQDATEAFRAFHTDVDHVKKYMRALHVGQMDPGEKDKDAELKKDFEELRQTAIKMNLFKPSVCFFVLNLLHIFAFEILAYLILYWYGTGWIPCVASVICYGIVEGQSGFTAHDYGHLSVFKSVKMNHLWHLISMNFVKGVSAAWWNHMHFQHHAKPNCLMMDPDVRLDPIFLVGETMPKRVAKQKNNILPYNWQHSYFVAIGPSFIFQIFFHYLIFRFVFTRKQWVDLAFMMTFFVRFFYLYSAMLGWWCLLYYFIFRFIGSYWFVWVTQSNHIPMEIDDDQERSWVPLQMHATCNIEKSFFNDWFTGHLNFQVEHHLFPCMPRHNLYKIRPLVQALCKKHDIPYVLKPLGTAFADIVRSLKHSGEIWQCYYESYHHM